MRTTSHRNEQTGKFEVFIVQDGPDGGTASVRVDSEWSTSPQANDRVRQMRDLTPEDLQKAYDAGKPLNPGSDPNLFPATGEPTRARDANPNPTVSSQAAAHPSRAPSAKTPPPPPPDGADKTKA